MKKIVPFMIIVIMMFAVSCKDMKVEFLWQQISFEGSYTEGVGSTIKVQAWTKIMQPNISKLPIQMNLYDWRITIREGNTPVLVLLKDSVYQQLGTVLINESEIELEFLWIYIDSESEAIGGDIYNGLSPDNMLVEFVIRDFDGNLYDYTAEVNIPAANFTRN